jgi:hypothetical protein
MLALALVLIVIGIVGLFLFTYAGVIVGAVGLVLLVAFLFGFGRSARSTQPHRF